jgi:hypothetical protein
MDLPLQYQIQVKGIVDASWFDYYDNMVLELDDEGEQRPLSTLTGSVPDQAALISILTLLYNMRYPLINVECLIQD